MNKDIPYYSQWESPELVTDILQKKIKASEDPNWKNSGAETPEEYEFWSWNICGMACLKSILDFTFKEKLKTINLAKDCAEYGGYKIEGNRIEGLYYKPFCKYVGEKFNLKASFFGQDLTIPIVEKGLTENSFFILSVNKLIRNFRDREPAKKGGHLVLVTGIDPKSRYIYIHNPSGYSGISQIHYKVPYTEFLKFFAKRGIIIRI
jgi:hypothetical protein